MIEQATLPSVELDEKPTLHVHSVEMSEEESEEYILRKGPRILDPEL